MAEPTPAAEFVDPFAAPAPADPSVAEEAVAPAVVVAAPSSEPADAPVEAAAAAAESRYQQNNQQSLHQNNGAQQQHPQQEQKGDAGLPPSASPVVMIRVMGEDVVDPASKLAPSGSDRRNSFIDKLSGRQLADLKAAFDLFDTDKSGSIDAVELASILKQLGQVPTQGELLDMLRQVDVDGNGTIEFEEFCRMMVLRGPSAGVVKADAIESFRVFDSEGNGRIGVPALRKALMSLGERFSDWEFEKWLEQAGLSVDDELDYVQYVESLYRADEQV